jgi:hypothetical protein
MRTGWARLLLVVGVAVLVAACGSAPPVSRHTPTPPATVTATPLPAATPEPTPTPAAGPVLAALSASDLATMTSVYVSYRDSEPGDGNLFPPGSLAVRQSHAATMPDGGEWAFLSFATTGTPTLEQNVGLQDGGSDAVYLRASPGSTWLLRGIAGEPACNSMVSIGVPPDVASLWGMTEPCPQS